jgi:hypothetical protein
MLMHWRGDLSDQQPTQSKRKPPFHCWYATVQPKLVRNCLIWSHSALVAKVAETRVSVAPAEVLMKDSRESFRQKFCMLHTVMCFSDYIQGLDWWIDLLMPYTINSYLWAIWCYHLFTQFAVHHYTHTLIFWVFTSHTLVMENKTVSPWLNLLITH